MLKNALTFAGAAMALVLLAPYFLPQVHSTAQQLAGPPPAPTTTPMAAAPANVSIATPDTGPRARDGFREKSIPPDARGQFWLDGLVDGASAHFVVDTGASMVSISADLAARLGAFDSPALPHYRLNTANGQATTYAVHLHRLDFGSIYVEDIDALVLPESSGNINLLGSNFLKRMASVEERDQSLILRQ